MADRAGLNACYSDTDILASHHPKDHDGKTTGTESQHVNMPVCFVPNSHRHPLMSSAQHLIASVGLVCVLWQMA